MSEVNRRSASTPTERFRSLLDERGIEWWYGIGEKSTVFDGEYGVRYEVDGTLGLLFVRSVLNVAPEQAIAATVGTGTCHMNVRDNLSETEGMGEVWLECDECHWQMQLEPTTPRFKYCPNCGKRIVREVSE